MAEVCIVGHFGGGKEFNDGQTIKTKTLYKSLKERNIDIDCVDTFYVKRNPFKFFCSLFFKTLTNRKFVILLSFKGRKILFPYFSFISKVFNKEIYHDVIGFKLVEEAELSKRVEKYLHSFSSNWVEGRIMKNRLERIGITNTVLVPNYKKLSSVNNAEILDKFDGKYKFCTFSRVIPEKGIEDAIHAIETLSTKYSVVLDIYGPIPVEYQTTFFSLIENSTCCNYKGVIPAEESVNTLKDYFCMLFPTYWKSEGMPGTIIDSFASALPIIAREWPLCDELISDGKTGIVYDFDKPELLVDKIEYALTHQEEVLNMRMNCLEEYQKYSEEVVVEQIIKLLVV